MTAPLVPELDVGDLEASLGFYVGTLGFFVRYRRPEDRFAYLEREGAEVMLEEAAGPGRRFRTALLEYPYGRGMNLQIACGDVSRLHATTVAAGAEIVIPLETRWYRVDAVERGTGNSWWPTPMATCCGSSRTWAKGRRLRAV